MNRNPGLETGYKNRFQNPVLKTFFLTGAENRFYEHITSPLYEKKKIFLTLRRIDPISFINAKPSFNIKFGHSTMVETGVSNFLEKTVFS